MRGKLNVLARDFVDLLSTRNEQRHRAVRTGLRLGASLGHKVWDDNSRIDSVKRGASAEFVGWRRAVGA